MTQNPRTTLFKEIFLSLGGQMVEVQLDPEHYDLAIQKALDRYRQRSGYASEESYVFLTTQPDVQDYKLAPEVQNVQYVYRRSVGSSGGGATFDPFSASFVNNIYSMQNPGGLGGGGAGWLATYDFAMQYQSLIGRMFGRDINFHYNSVTKMIRFERRFTANEELLLQVRNLRTEEFILNDIGSRPWVRDYAIGCAKIMLGEAYSVFATLAGPQGGITLKGDALKTEGQAMLDKLDLEVFNLVDSDEGYGFCIG